MRLQHTQLEGDDAVGDVQQALYRPFEDLLL